MAMNGAPPPDGHAPPPYGRPGFGPPTGSSGFGPPTAPDPGFGPPGGSSGVGPPGGASGFGPPGFGPPGAPGERVGSPGGGSGPSGGSPSFGPPGAPGPGAGRYGQPGDAPPAPRYDQPGHPRPPYGPAGPGYGPGGAGAGPGRRRSRKGLIIGLVGGFCVLALIGCAIAGYHVWQHHQQEQATLAIYQRIGRPAGFVQQGEPRRRYHTELFAVWVARSAPGDAAVGATTTWLGRHTKNPPSRQDVQDAFRTGRSFSLDDQEPASVEVTLSGAGTGHRIDVSIIS